MAQARFDLSDAARLESRAGGVGTGALVRNGFVEVDAEKERWSWQRPALATGETAPFSGKGLGLISIGNDLYGISYGTGTGTTSATSWLVQLNRQNSFTLVAASGASNLFGYEVAGFGNLTPSTWSSVEVDSLNGQTGTSDVTVLSMSIAVSSSFLTKLTLNGRTMYTSTGTYVGNGWIWPGAAISAVGTYTGNFA